MKNQILIFLILAGAMSIRAQNGSLGRITISSCGTSDSRISVTMGEPLAGSFISSDGKTILTVGAQAGHIQNVSDSLSLSDYTVNIDSNASNFDINLYSNRSWQISNPSGWLSINILTGLKDAKLSFSATANNGIDTRSAEVVIAAGSNVKTVVVSQKGKSMAVDEIINKSFDVLIYPNPFSTGFKMELSKGSDICTAKIIDQLGQTVYQNNSLRGMNEILFPELADGTYFLLLSSLQDGYLKTYKITKINNN